MRWSNFYIPTLKEDPQDAKVSSHKLMIRAGLIRKLSAGIYSYLPLGLKALKRIENIIRDEMDKQQAIEVMLPVIHPLHIWEKSGRLKTLIDDVGYKFKDRHNNYLVLGPTHEEVITDLVAGEINSYKDLPKNFYQIQVKFRDEPRPRFGVIRSKEFIMKDAYSFDKDAESLDRSYKKMDKAYRSILNRCGLDYIVVEADPGMMGGKESAEFMIESSSGEDKIAVCKSCSWAASLEVAKCTKPEKIKREKTKPLRTIDTPAAYTVKQVTETLNVPASKLVKTLIYKSNDEYIAVLVRGDKTINESKLRKALGRTSLKLADNKEIEKLTNAPVGYSGPVGLKKVRIIADYQVENMSNFVTGANEKDRHFVNVNIGRDFKIDNYFDLRYINEEDACPICNKKIQIKSVMEIGHVFKLGTRYSKQLKANYLDKDGQEKPLVMGCYGIGVNRLLAAIIELNHDKEGIKWPISCAPFEVLILPLDKEADKVAEDIYNKLEKEDIAVLLDDRNMQAGVKFKDADLIGIPIQIILGSKNLKKDKVEIKLRASKERQLIDKKDVISYSKKILTM